MAEIKEITENKHHLDRTNSELYKELEIINFTESSKRVKTGKRDIKAPFLKLFRRKSKVTSREVAWKKQSLTQIVIFQRSMKLLLLCGQFIGLIPVIGITGMDITKMRFKYLSLRFIYSVLIFAWQAIASILCVYRLCQYQISISHLAFASFFSSITISTFQFIRIAAKWPSLMKEIANSCLDKYVDLSLETKCTRYTAGLMLIALVEHLLSQITKVWQSHGCSNNKNCSVYEAYLHATFPWFMEIGVPFNIPTGILLQFINIVSTVNWSYSDGFIVCMSFYLVSLLNQINKTIQEADKRFYHPTFWARIREDYTRATRLVSSFDNAISGIVLISFASNLFFICLQLFYVLAHGLRGNYALLSSANINTELSLNTTMSTRGEPSPINGSEVYFVISFTFILCRFLAVSFVAASVHTASLAPAPLLYTVPSNAYCSEVQRFQDQIHGTTVALSGLQFFYVTRGLVLSVAGTVITYELVLLQFSDEE